VCLSNFSYPFTDADRPGDEESGDAHHIATPESIPGNAPVSDGCGLECADGLRRWASAGGRAGNGHEGGGGRAGEWYGCLNPRVGTHADLGSRRYAGSDSRPAHQDADPNQYTHAHTRSNTHPLAHKHTYTQPYVDGNANAVAHKYQRTEAYSCTSFTPISVGVSNDRLVDSDPTRM